MNTISFYKYQGTGNDFVMIDNRKAVFSKENTSLIARLCNRNYGIGADGLILLENHDFHDFNMVYYNADGRQSTMCGNGGRCIVKFAQQLGVIEDKATFNAIDGLHHAYIKEDIVSLQMTDVFEIKKHDDYVFTNTGSPHHVQLVDQVDQVDVFKQGRDLRNNLYGKDGANINFVEPINENTYHVRTYERGVEDETQSCGTGVTAVAIAMHYIRKTVLQEVNLETLGGRLQVNFDPIKKGYENVWLTGPATFVFKGSIEL